MSKLQLPKSPLVWFINSQGKNTLIRGQIKIKMMTFAKPCCHVMLVFEHLHTSARLTNNHYRAFNIRKVIGRPKLRFGRNFAFAILNLEHYYDVTLVENVAGRVDRHPWEVLDFLGLPGKRETYSGNIFRALPMVKAEKPLTTDTFK